MHDINKLSDEKKIELFSHMLVSSEIWSTLAYQPKKFEKVVENFNSILNDSNRNAERNFIGIFDEKDLINFFFEMGKTKKQLIQTLQQSVIDLRKVDILIKENCVIANQISEEDKNVKEASRIKKLIGKSKCIVDGDNINLFISKEFADFQYGNKIDSDVSFVGSMKEIYNPEFQRVLHKAVYEASISDILKDIEYSLKQHNNFIQSTL